MGSSSSSPNPKPKPGPEQVTDYLAAARAKEAARGGAQQEIHGEIKGRYRGDIGEM